MITYRCRCGETVAYTSMGVARCESCSKCGSSLMPLGVNDWPAPEPHQPVTRYDQMTGKPYQICERCWQKL